jgi:hypothetical protein
MQTAVRSSEFEPLSSLAVGRRYQLPERTWSRVASARERRQAQKRALRYSVPAQPEIGQQEISTQKRGSAKNSYKLSESIGWEAWTTETKPTKPNKYSASHSFAHPSSGF